MDKGSDKWGGTHAKGHRTPFFFTVRFVLIFLGIFASALLPAFTLDISLVADFHLLSKKCGIVRGWVRDQLSVEK